MHRTPPEARLFSSLSAEHLGHPLHFRRLAFSLWFLCTDFSDFYTTRYRTTHCSSGAARLFFFLFDTCASPIRLLLSHGTRATTAVIWTLTPYALPLRLSDDARKMCSLESVLPEISHSLLKTTATLVPYFCSWMFAAAAAMSNFRLLLLLAFLSYLFFLIPTRKKENSSYGLNFWDPP